VQPASILQLSSSLVCFLFISILAIKDFQNCSIAKIIIIDKPNNAMFCFSLELPWDGYSLPPHPIFMFSGALIDSQILFCIDIFFLPGIVHGLIPNLRVQPSFVVKIICVPSTKRGLESDSEKRSDLQISSQGKSSSTYLLADAAETKDRGTY
jgi:hypothetical protein